MTDLPRLAVTPKQAENITGWHPQVRFRVPALPTIIPEGARVEVGWWEGPGFDVWHPVATATLAELEPVYVTPRSQLGGVDDGDWLVTLTDVEATDD